MFVPSVKCEALFVETFAWVMGQTHLSCIGTDVHGQLALQDNCNSLMGMWKGYDAMVIIINN